MDYLYYRFYLFYKNIFKESDPHITAVVVFSACQFLLLDMIISSIYIFLRCESQSGWVYASVAILILISNFVYFLGEHRYKKIIAEKKEIKNKFYLVGFVLFFVVSFSMFFLTGIVGKILLDNCN